MTAERFSSDNIKPIIDKYKRIIKAFDYDHLLRLLKETADYQTGLQNENSSLREQNEDFRRRLNPKIHCIKCGGGSAQDSRGWERIRFPIGEGINLRQKTIWLCPKCILESQAVKDYISEFEKDGM